MVSGKKKDPAPQVTQIQMSPATLRTPFGSVSGKGDKITFNPAVSKQDQKLLGQLDVGLRNYAAELGRTPTWSEVFNNPYYGQTRQRAMQQLDQQQAQEQRTLTNGLNARNQLGGSYAAYTQDLMNRRYQDARQNADWDARQASMSAYNDRRAQSLDSMSTLQNLQSSVFDRLYMPAKLYTGYQSNLNQMMASKLNAETERQRNQYMLANSQAQRQSSLDRPQELGPTKSRGMG